MRRDYLIQEKWKKYIEREKNFKNIVEYWRNTC